MATQLRVEQLYGVPVLLSGLAALVLSKSELDTLDHHFKRSLERLLKLYRATPAPVVYYLAGCLPASAQLHLKQISLLGMISRLGPSHILFQHGNQVLENPEVFKKSWFLQVREACLQYNLPDPRSLLVSPLSKTKLKRLAKAKVLEFWPYLPYSILLYPTFSTFPTKTYKST